ncbi:receptor-type tyrosine-protein phosphatase H-like [Heterodontus francisci]|uniref:receptor-type tyrosine-protein phosphatase H-like n=1 Tax=Heterodontus francisci TaxID=7792 RepID=UPI00355BB540
MGPNSHWPLLLLTLIPAWEAVYSKNCSEPTVFIVPVNTTALNVSWTIETEDFRQINLTLEKVTKESNDSNGSEIFSDLEHGMKYNVSITVEYLNCSLSNSYSGTTNPSQVTSLSVLNRTTESLTIGWTVPTDTRASNYTYNITVTSDIEAFSETYTTGPGETVFRVTDLKPGVEYNLMVMSVTPENTLSAPENLKSTTNPSLVTSLSVLNRTTESLTIGWTAPTDTRASNYTYNITVTSDTEAFSETYTTGPGETVFRVTDLKPGVEYQLMVKSVTPENTLSAPENVEGTTNPSLVTSLSVLNRTTESLTIGWTAPTDTRASNYTYNITVTSDTEAFSETYTTGPGETVFRVTDLKPGVEYNLMVMSVTPENTLSAPENVKSTTNPSLVTSLSVLNRTTESLTIGWTAPTDTRASNYTYNITVTSDTGTFSETYTTGETVFQVTDLKPGVEYNLMVMSVTPENTLSAPENLKSTTNPSLVTSLSVLNRTTESLTIGWTAPTDTRASNYTYNITVTSDTEAFSETYTTGPGETVFPVTDLKPGVEYNLMVMSVTPENTLSAPENVKSTTNPSLVTSLSVLNRTTESLAIGWTAPTDTRASNYTYNITVTSDTGTFSETYTTGPGETVFQVTDLKPGVEYNLTVMSVTPENTLSAPENLKSTTNPSPVTDLSVTKRTTNSLMLHWKASNDMRVSAYIYRVKADSMNFSKTNHTSPGETEYLVEFLTPGVQYSLSVESVTPEHTSSTPENFMDATLPGAPSALQCAHNTGYTIKVEWTKPKGNFTGFNISSYDGHKLLTVQTTGKNVNFLTIGNLQPGRKYTIDVYTQTGQSYSAKMTQQCWTNSLPIIIGAVIGCLLGLILIGLLLFIVITKRVPWREKRYSESSPMFIIPTEFKPVPVSEYESYFKSKHADTDFGFAEEYQSLSTVGTEQSMEAALLLDNKGKNRYTNVLPYDATRVKLTPQPESSTSDYINANYMPGYTSKMEFIAAQGPLPSTVADFWRMIWEQKSEVIVMLTNCVELNRVKCEHYWPLDYTPCTYGDITVTVTSETILADWTLRDFIIKEVGSSETRSVSHFHFTVWPDHGVPKTTEKLLAFRQLIRDHLNKKPRGLPIIHCSAGVGRTGTLIALDYLLQEVQQENVIDVYGIVHKMRQNRSLMVQTELQYVFLHQCMLDTIQSSQSEEPIYENQQDLIYENVSVINSADRHHY